MVRNEEIDVKDFEVMATVELLVVSMEVGSYLVSGII